MASEQAVRAFVRSLVPTIADSNDVRQEVAIVLSEKFAEYPTSDDFRRWAFGVAKLRLKELLTRRRGSAEKYKFL